MGLGHDIVSLDSDVDQRNGRHGCNKEIDCLGFTITWNRNRNRNRNRIRGVMLPMMSKLTDLNNMNCHLGYAYIHTSLFYTCV